MFSSVGEYIKAIVLSSTFSPINPYFGDMCLDCLLLCCVSCSAITMVLLLSCIMFMVACV